MGACIFSCRFVPLAWPDFFSGRRRHTRPLRDWSSDVCSSDLLQASRGGGAGRRARLVARGLAARRAVAAQGLLILLGDPLDLTPQLGRERRGGGGLATEIGRASCRVREWVVGEGVNIKKDVVS